MEMALEFTTSFHKDALSLFHYYKRLAERAMEQLSDDELFRTIDGDANSIAIIVKHMTGNMRSRFTNFLDEDGEKPWRNRDAEFQDPLLTRQAVLDDWASAWDVLFGAIEPLTDDDMNRTVTVRGEPHSVMQAILRQVAHYAHHTGQIVLLAKHYRGEAWQSLSVPKGQSAEFTSRVRAGEISQR